MEVIDPINYFFPSDPATQEWTNEMYRFMDYAMTMSINKPTLITLFYAGMVYGEYDKPPKQNEVPEDVYQGGIMYCHFEDKPGSGRHWWRMDRTPMLDEDVPPELKAWILIL